MSLETGSLEKLKLLKTIVPVSGCRKVFKKDMVLNNVTPNIEVDPETYEVRVDGEHLTCEPLETLPLAQRYFLF